MKKNVRYSFWAIFNNKQQRQLESLKKKINNELKGPYFPIHMSLCGELLEDKRELINKIKKNLSKLNKFSIETNNYGYKNTFFQSLYIKVIKNTKLVSQKKIIDNIFNCQTRFFNPHISLYYGQKHSNLKKKIISNLPNIKKVIKIRNLCLSCREEKKSKWSKEKKLKWKIVETFRI